MLFIGLKIAIWDEMNMQPSNLKDAYPLTIEETVASSPKVPVALQDLKIARIARTKDQTSISFEGQALELFGVQVTAKGEETMRFRASMGVGSNPTQYGLHCFNCHELGHASYCYPQHQVNVVKDEAEHKQYFE